MKVLLTYRHQVALIIVLVLHAVGLVGIAREPLGSLTALTPVNLWICGLVVIVVHLIEARQDLWRFVVVFLGGFLVECLGVQTGIPFGSYSYLENFGFQLWDTPLVIGMNWLVLSYCATHLWRQVTKSPWIAVLGGATMVGLDVLIECIAPVLRFWAFEGGTIPWQNYLSWFVLGTLACAVLVPGKAVRNPAAIVLLAVQALFFASLVLLL